MLLEKPGKDNGGSRKAQEDKKSGIHSKSGQKNGANARNRTEDLFITSEPLYRLSYVGIREIIM